MKTRLSVFFWFFLSHLAICQKYDYTWLSGAYNIADDTATNFGIGFSFFPPQINKVKSDLNMSYANLSMSNANGMLSYYTNGCIVRTKDHTMMENGEYINEGTSNTAYSNNCGATGTGLYPVIQGIFALPYDNNINELIHTRFESNLSGPNSVCLYGALLHSRIDMNANQGLGKVAFKDSVLIEGCLQTACANRHANGRDWWILLPDNVSNRFYRFLSTPDGIQGPWIQEIENPTIDTFFYLGWSEFSPDGERFMINDIHSGTAIYHFDRCTGLLSDLHHLPGNLESYGLASAFSPDSRFAYIVKGNFTTIEQFDLDATDILASRTTIAEWDTFYYYQPGGGPRQTFFSFFQHGPDGKLYNWAGDTKYMHVMNFPNRKGAKCDFRQRAIELPYYTFGANAYYPNYRLGPVDGSSCDTLGIDNHPAALFRYDLEDTLSPLQVTFTDLSYYEPAQWHWNFGDGVTSQDTSPVHIFPAAGTYNVCLTVSNQYAADTVCKEVTVGVNRISEADGDAPGITVFPNPTSGRVFWTGAEGRPMTVRVYNQLTQLVLERFCSANFLDMSAFPTGMYRLQFLTENGRSQVTKSVVLQK